MECRIGICSNDALENGYCVDHQDFVGVEPDSSLKKYNSVEISLKIIAWILILTGIILGIMQSRVTNDIGDINFNAVVFFIYLFVGITSGGLFLGLAEIIKLLERSTEVKKEA